MKRLIIYFIICFVFTNGYSQPVPTPPVITRDYSKYDFYEENVNGVSVYKWKKNNQKVSEYIHFACEFNTHYPAGLEGEGLFVNGLKHGKWKLRECDLSVQQEINYNKGLITGHYKVFFEFGTTQNGKWIHIRDTVLYETNFVNGNGEWKNFYDYFDDSTQTRQFTIKETGFYENGKKSGEWCYYLTQSWCHNYTERGVFLYRKEFYENGILVKKEDFEIPEEYEPCFED